MAAHVKSVLNLYKKCYIIIKMVIHFLQSFKTCLTIIIVLIITISE